jgi:hypothetical protein
MTLDVRPVLRERHGRHADVLVLLKVKPGDRAPFVGDAIPVGRSADEGAADDLAVALGLS